MHKNGRKPAFPYASGFTGFSVKPYEKRRYRRVMRHSRYPERITKTAQNKLYENSNSTGKAGIGHD